METIKFKFFANGGCSSQTDNGKSRTYIFKCMKFKLYRLSYVIVLKAWFVINLPTHVTVNR